MIMLFTYKSYSNSSNSMDNSLISNRTYRKAIISTNQTFTMLMMMNLANSSNNLTIHKTNTMMLIK